MRKSKMSKSWKETIDGDNLIVVKLTLDRIGFHFSLFLHQKTLSGGFEKRPFASWPESDPLIVNHLHQVFNHLESIGYWLEKHLAAEMLHEISKAIRRLQKRLKHL